jgi:hypothetical protein
VLALLARCGAPAAGQTPADPSTPSASDTSPASPPSISYAGGQLKIDALDATLADVLRKVAALTGTKIDLPPGAGGDRLPIVKLGPGPAREILASLLSDSSFDYLIQASDTDPEKIQSVVIMAREKKGSGSAGTDVVAGRQSRSPYARHGAPPLEEDAAMADSPAPAQQITADAVSQNQQPEPAQPDQPAPRQPAQPDQPAPLPVQPGQLVQPELFNGTPMAPMTTPSVLNQQSINQQLQQMYQQRAQINQQNQANQPAAPANSGSTK